MRNVFGSRLPLFETVAVYPGADNASTIMKPFCNKSFAKDEYSIHFWVPKAFTFICPVEIREWNQKYDELKGENIGVYIYSGDTPEVIAAWIASKDQGLSALGPIKMPFVSDSLCGLAKCMGGYLEGDANHRCSVRMSLITKGDTVLYYEALHPLVGRSIEEIIRKCRAIKHVTDHPGELCIPQWKKPGDKLIDLNK